MSIEDIEGIKLALTNMSKQINERLDNHGRFLESIKSNYKILDAKISDIDQKNKNRYKSGDRPSMNQQPSKNEQKPGVLNSIKDAFIDCLSTTTGHGLPQMVKPGNLFLSLVWAFFVLVGFCGAIFMIYQAIEQFLRYDVITITKIKREKEMIFPALTFCAVKVDPDNNNIIKVLDFGCKFLKDGPEIDCSYADIVLYDYYWMDKVNCIQFNFGTNKDRLVKFYKNRTRYSFTSHFYYPNDTKLYFGLTNNSARVVLEDLTEDLFPGHDTYVALSKTEQTALGPPHSQCNDSEGYSQMICTENCFNQNITESCGCDYPVECINTTEKTQRNFYERSELCEHSYVISDSIWSNCRSECPVECSQVIFSFNRMDFEIHVKPYYLDIFKSVAEKKFNITDTGSEQFVERLTSICVYFDRFETTQITQSESISLTSLIANVGGLLGLFLGFSLLSSIELIDLLIRICFILGRNKLSNSIRQTNPE